MSPRMLQVSLAVLIAGFALCLFKLNKERTREYGKWEVATMVLGLSIMGVIGWLYYHP